MKKLIIISISFLTLLSYSQSQSKEFDIVGKWKGVDSNEISYIIFQDDGFAAFEVDGMVLGGEEFEMDGKKGSMRYEIDYSQKILKIDFIVTVIDDQISDSLLCIAEIVDNDRIRMVIGFEGERPTEFDIDTDLLFQRVQY